MLSSKVIDTFQKGWKVQEFTINEYSVTSGGR
jgi:hypothetical protein